MPLITERSITSWARKLATEEGETFEEVLRAIVNAVFAKELPVFHPSLIGPVDEPINVFRSSPIIDSLTAVLYWPYLGPGLGEDRWKQHLVNLEDARITTVDMTSWLQILDAAKDEPKPAERKTELEIQFNDWFLDKYPSGQKPRRVSIKTLVHNFEDNTHVVISESQARRFLGLKK